MISFDLQRTQNGCTEHESNSLASLSSLEDLSGEVGACTGSISEVHGKIRTGREIDSSPSEGGSICVGRDDLVLSEQEGKEGVSLEGRMKEKQVNGRKYRKGSTYV